MHVNNPTNDIKCTELCLRLKFDNNPLDNAGFLKFLLVFPPLITIVFVVK